MRLRGDGARWVVVCVMCVGLCGCPKEQPSTPGTGPTGTAAPATGDAGGAKTVKIAVIPKGTAHSYWLAVKAGADAAARDLNAPGRAEKIEIDWDGPANETDITGQINLVQTKVTGGINGIVLAATNQEALIPPVKDAIAKGVPVVTVDSGLKQDSDPSYCYIATDNVQGGRLAADALAKEMGQKGKVGVLGFLKGAASNDDRVNGFMEGIKKYPGITVVTTLYDDSDAAKALDQSTNMLTAAPDITGIFAANEPGGVGAGNYLKQRGLIGKVKLVAYDTSDDEIKDLQAGIIQALIVQDPFQMGYKGVQQVLNAIHHQAAPTPKFIDSGVEVVTKENFQTPKVQKLLNPPS